jgi:hypothetical protein
MIYSCNVECFHAIKLKLMVSRHLKKVQESMASEAWVDSNVVQRKRASFSPSSNIRKLDEDLSHSYERFIVRTIGIIFLYSESNPILSFYETDCVPSDKCTHPFPVVL